MTTPARPFFLETADAGLFALWRASEGAPSRCWVVCPPFAEEEKCAHRTLTECCLRLLAEGYASLSFAYRGTGDSGGDFAAATLDDWRADIATAAAEARKLAAEAGSPNAELGLLGLRLGATLALQEAEKLGAGRVVLIEPLISGRQFLNSLTQRRRLRAMLTQEYESAEDAPPEPDISLCDGGEDLDGWELGAAMREQIGAINMETALPSFAGRVRLLQVGPREQAAPALRKLGDALRTSAQPIVMQPFWNMLDYAPAPALLDAIAAPF